MTQRNPTSQVCTRRQFLQATAAGTAAMMTAPYVALGRRHASEEESERVLGEAENRIRQHRMGAMTLRLLGPDGKPWPAGQEVQIHQIGHRFLFGCNIFKLGRCRSPEQNDAYATQFAGLLNYATVPFYWWNYERQRGRSQDERTDEVVRWCNAHDVAMKGHPLAWNYRDPAWLRGTPEEVMRLQLARIERCVDRFEGDIDIWDVVNEATHYDRAECKRESPLLTSAIAEMGVGPYVRAAFRKACQANPDATLVINDYRTDPAFADQVVAELLDENGRALYDVIGIQSHMHGGPWGAARTWEVCERFARFGKPLHFTETTLVSGPKNDSGWTTTADGEERQAELAAEFYTVLFSHPAVEAITWWDFSDQGAWQQAPAGLIRSDMTPKPIYERLSDLIKGKWWTQSTAGTETNGWVKVEGFLGDYEVAVQQGGRRLAARFVLAKDACGPVDVALREAPDRA